MSWQRCTDFPINLNDITWKSHLYHNLCEDSLTFDILWTVIGLWGICPTIIYVWPSRDQLIVKVISAGPLWVGCICVTDRFCSRLRLDWVGKFKVAMNCLSLLRVIMMLALIAAGVLAIRYYWLIQWISNTFQSIYTKHTLFPQKGFLIY